MYFELELSEEPKSSTDAERLGYASDFAAALRRDYLNSKPQKLILLFDFSNRLNEGVVSGLTQKFIPAVYDSLHDSTYYIGA